MPELPEVETTCRALEPHLVGRQIVRVDVRNPRLRWPIPEAIQKNLTKSTITAIHRRAKYLLFHTTHGIALAHLGMSGRMRITPTNTLPEKHDHYDWLLDNKTSLRYTDPRRFGCLLWLGDQPDSTPPLLAKLGPEPLEPGFDGDYLWQRSRTHRTAIKTFLMDNHIVVGVGNIYANESLFLTGIRPTTPANKISRTRYQALAQNIRSVLQQAIQAGGTTFRDFVSADGKPGYFQQALYVYGRDGEACKRCQTTIKQLQQGQRSSFYCPQCQR